MKLVFDGISKSYGKTKALPDFSAELSAGIYAPPSELSGIVAAENAPRSVFLTLSFNAGQNTKDTDRCPLYSVLNA